MPTETSIYRAMDFFMVRAPILPFDLFSKYFLTEGEEPLTLKRTSLAYLIELSENRIIREAIAAASPNLLESLVHLGNEDNLRKRGQVVKGFMRYLLRMMTRPTPFGLFSGVTYGKFGERSRLNLNGIDTYIKHARPDMEWLLKIIGSLENKREVVCQLKIQRNTLIYRQGNRAKLPYTTRYGGLGEGGNESVSVRASAVFDCVMDACTNPISYSKLISWIRERFKKAEIETIEHYVWQLFEQEFLISELRPPTTTTDPLGHVMSVLESITGMEDLKDKLHRIREDIFKYNLLPVGQGEEMLSQLRKAMNEIMNVKSPLQIDLSLEDRSITLTDRIRKDVEKAAQLLCRTSSRRNRHLEEYCNEFLENYGPYREVPILELLDEETGLGAPATYSNPQSHRRRLTSTVAKQEQLLLQWFVSCLHRGEQEVMLTDEMVEQLMDDNKSQELIPLPSMELYFQLVAHNHQKLDDGEYTLVLSPNPGSDGAGRTFGRFIDLFGDRFKETFNIIHQEEQRLSPSKLFAEISYLPSVGRSTNVVLTENFRKYEIAIGTNHTMPAGQQIHVSDLVVGVRHNRFYLKSRKHNREVVPTAGHMLNYRNAPNVYRFLMEVSQEGYRPWSVIEWGSLAQSPFTPRLRYEKIILCPATWRIQISQITTGKENVENLGLVVQQFREEWKVPRFVYMIQFDNRILLDLDHPLHVEEICKDLKSNAKVTLIEHIGGFEGLPIHRSDGRVVAEFVFPLVRGSGQTCSLEEIAATSEIDTKPLVEEIRHIHLPGGPWFYAKLYGLGTRQDEFIGRYWEGFVRECREEGVVDQAYFIRYSDPNRHIRARFKISKEEAQFVRIFHNWTKTLLQEGVISKVIIDTYEPEIERYGGPELMFLAERLFAADSEVTSNLVRLIRFQQIQLSKENVAVLSVIYLLYQFGNKEQEVYELLNEKFYVKDYLDDFRQERRLFMQMLGGENGVKPSHLEGDVVYRIVKTREAAVRCYWETLLDQEKKGVLTNTKDDILFSIIHMHLNRFLGTDRDQERKVMIMARHAMNSLVQYRRTFQ
ncbi:lantibiotic dehydratase [Paenibacillus sp. MZ04-78.2]|uniref:lantibiotic dehydratase n=1 Tax=Paenibacillus sp. MZ04-78.2 TaxID=2962034 RepID=UPI0020B7D870|nr:lantibiotic dehydratase [Paenibacillus sp. MZ04-78.2]MCP3776478.1 lantibiotic dehydratase [Paenibacillus sp. MZ04-78.2]